MKLLIPRRTRASVLLPMSKTVIETMRLKRRHGRNHVLCSITQCKAGLNEVAKPHAAERRAERTSVPASPNCMLVFGVCRSDGQDWQIQLLEYSAGSHRHSLPPATKTRRHLASACIHPGMMRRSGNQSCRCEYPNCNRYQRHNLSLYACRGCHSGHQREPTGRRDKFLLPGRRPDQRDPEAWDLPARSPDCPETQHS